jgi:cation diffusion facilitator CzcD-associated flavoprotein CzcO
MAVTRRPHVLVAGGGIGGLATALAGFDKEALNALGSV